MVSTVDQVLGMTINGDEGEEVTFMDSGIPSPYLQVPRVRYALTFLLWIILVLLCVSQNCICILFSPFSLSLSLSLPSLSHPLSLILSPSSQYGADAGGPSSSSSAAQDDRSKADKSTV